MRTAVLQHVRIPGCRIPERPAACTIANRTVCRCRMYSDKPSFSFLQWLAGLHSMSLAPQFSTQKNHRKSEESAAALSGITSAWCTFSSNFEVVLQRKVKATDAVATAEFGIPFSM